MYKALYRKWRPLTFDDVVSQPHITTTLRNQIINKKTAHAYLFTGSRGTGKTTCARIFAKTINCPNEKDGTPCLECEICKNADAGTLSDIIEIDAASNTGVDDIRELRDSTIYTPELCKFKVYIIDEVHMLSMSAFNALLKIMEEPPSYVKFILATTEVHKVPATILSRCQRFDFRRIILEDLISRIKYISSEENISLDDEAASLIARISDGGMRDALSLLDQCIAFTDGEINLEAVSNAAGIAGRDYLFEILDAIFDKNSAVAINVVDKLYSLSKDMQRLCEELLSQFRNLMLLKTMKNAENLLTCLPFEIERLKEIADKVELDRVLQSITILQECNEKLIRAISKRVEIEMCMIKLCNSPHQNNNVAQNSFQPSVDIELLLNRISVLESLVSSANSGKPIKVKPAPEVERTISVQEEPDEIKNASPSSLEPLSCWAEILEAFEKINPAVAGSLHGSVAYTLSNSLLIVVENDFFLSLLKIKENSLSLQEFVKQFLGKAYNIRAKSSVAAKEASESPLNKLINKAQISNIEVEIK